MAKTGPVGRLVELEPLLLTAALWFFASFVRFIFPPVFEPLQDSYGVSNTQLGLAFTGMMAAYAVVQFPSGLLADHFGSVKVIVAGALVSGLAAITVLQDHLFIALVGAMVLIGAGTGAHRTAVVRLLSRAYPDRTGWAMGIVDTVGSFGGVLAPAAVVLFVGFSAMAVPGWRLLFFLSGVGGTLLAVGYFVRIPATLSVDVLGRSTRDDGEGIDVRQYARLFWSLHFSTFATMAVLFSFTYNGVIAFLPLYLAREAGLSTSTASLIFSAMFAASLVQLVTGHLGDRIGELPVIVLTLGLSTTALVALVSLTSTGNAVLLGIAAVAIGMGSHGYRPVRSAYVMSIVPSSTAGGSLGAVRTLFIAAGAAAPAFVGYLSEVAGFEAAFWALAISMVGSTAAAVIMWVFMDTRPVGEKRESADA